MHLADAFIQSDLQCIQAIHFFFYQYGNLPNVRFTKFTIYQNLPNLLVKMCTNPDYGKVTAFLIQTDFLFMNI